jgi:hypothetical protein
MIIDKTKIPICIYTMLVRFVLILLILLAEAAIPLFAQQERVTFPNRVITIDDAFKQIQKQTRYLLSVASDNTFDVTVEVGLSSTELPLSTALTELLAGSGKQFSFRGRHILIYKPKVKPVVYDTLRNEPVNVDSLAYMLQVKKKTDYDIDYPDEPVLNVDFLRKVHRSPAPLKTKRPVVALQTNLLYDALAYTPNLGLEVGIARRSTLLLSGSYNGWNLDGSRDNNKKLAHWLVGLEYRYWFCQRFAGHFLGVHAFGGHYNISGHNIPLIFEKHAVRHRYEGDVYAAGIDYGYHWLWSKHWSMEFNVGVGVGVLKYDKYDAGNCGQCRSTDEKRTFVAPTKAAVSLIYVIK